MRLAAAFVFLWLLAATAAVAQSAATPADPGRPADATSPVGSAVAPVISPVRPAQPPHKFFDLKNSLAIASFGAALAGDSYSTQRSLAYPRLHELNPVARPFVSSRSGEIVYSGASFVLFGGGMYLAHRTAHHKLERLAPWIVAGWEGFLAGWNLHQIALVRAGR
jgi:hypothetical protein